MTDRKAKKGSSQQDQGKSRNGKPNPEHPNGREKPSEPQKRQAQGDAGDRPSSQQEVDPRPTPYDRSENDRPDRGGNGLDDREEPRHASHPPDEPRKRKESDDQGDSRGNDGGDRVILPGRQNDPNRQGGASHQQN